MSKQYDPGHHGGNMPPQSTNFDPRPNRGCWKPHLEIINPARWTGWRNCRSGQGRRKKNPDPKGRQGVRQAHPFKQKGRITWQQRPNPPSNLNRLRELALQVNRTPTSSILSRTKMLTHCSSYLTRATDWSFLKLDSLKKSVKLIIPITTCIIGCWDTLPRAVMSAKTSFRLWLTHRY